MTEFNLVTVPLAKPFFKVFSSTYFPAISLGTNYFFIDFFFFAKNILKSIFVRGLITTNYSEIHTHVHPPWDTHLSASYSYCFPLTKEHLAQDGLPMSKLNRQVSTPCKHGKLPLTTSVRRVTRHLRCHTALVPGVLAKHKTSSYWA